MTSRRTIILALVSIAVMALLVLALMPSPVPVSVAEAQRGYFAEWVEDEGRTRVRDPHTVSSPINGYLRRVQLEPGDEVAAGDLLFELEALPAPALDPRSREQAREAASAAQARLELAEAQLEIAATDREVAELEYRRNVDLYAQNFIAAETMDRSRGRRAAAVAGERAARHAVDIARFELEAARANLAVADGRRAPEDQPTLQITAPIGGTVINRHRCCEGPVNAGEPVLEIGDLSTLEVQIDLLSMDAVRVRPGMRVALERWGGGEALEGEVRRVEPRGFQRISALGVEEQRVPVLVSIRSSRDAWEGLGEGFRVEGRFFLWESEDELAIPSSALFREDERWQVFVVVNGRAQQRAVEVGRRSGLRTQITAGLDAGQRVITHPGDRIADGSRIAAELR